MLDINLMGTVRGSRAMLATLRESRGHLVNRASFAAIANAPGMAAYIEFGRFAAINRQRRGQGRRGRFQIVRLTAKKRVPATLRSIRTALMRRRLEPVAVTGRWLNRVVQGYFNYHAVPTNLTPILHKKRRTSCNPLI